MYRGTHFFSLNISLYISVLKSPKKQRFDKFLFFNQSCIAGWLLKMKKRKFKKQGFASL
jgi:hypothetical protein